MRAKIVCAAVISVFSFGFLPAHATSVTFNDFSSTAGLTLTGNAGTAVTGDGTVLRITPASSNQAGAAYSTTPVTLGSGSVFSTQFQFRFTNTGGVSPADGITFVLAQSPSGLGVAGYGMGYEGVSHSVAIEFDTYDNGLLGTSLGYFAAEPNSSNHVALDLNGVLTNTAWTNVYGVGAGYSGAGSCGVGGGGAGCMSNGDLWTVNIGYDGSTLTLALLDPAKGSTFQAINYALDLSSYLGGNAAYVGFTGSTGAGWENQDIVNWQFADTTRLSPGTTPLPAALPLFASGLGGLGLLGWRRKRKKAAALAV